MIDIPKFTFEGNITKEQQDYFNQHGFLHFKGFFNSSEIEKLWESIEKVQDNWITNNVEKVNGTPIKYGKDENGNKIVQRFAFTSLFSSDLQNFLNSNKIQVLKSILGNEARIADKEKDGVVINHFINTDNSSYSKLGWHTDVLRDLFFGLKLQPMLNIGIYFDDSPKQKGGLRLLPGSHKQNIYKLLFRKRYFVDNTFDKNEIAIEAEKGDLTIHHGKIWHRVALSELKGIDSRRRVMYFPIISGKYKPKSDQTKTPFYHKFQKFIK